MPFRRSSDPQTRPTAVFELRRNDGQFFFYPQRKLIHIAGMVRHLAIELMKQSPPPGIENADQWVDRFVAGHRDKNRDEHRQFSYLPLPSIGHRHADQAIRRVMISAPPGDDAWLEHLAGRLAGQQLEPENGGQLGEQGPPTLVRVRYDKIANCYLSPRNRWASVTPVILPGHDDHKPAKTRKLIETALAQAGIEQPCEFEYSAFSRFRKSFSAHKYGRDKRPQGYFRPDHLSTQTAVHLTLMFNEEVKVPGPLVIGAGRHCGFGLMAAQQE
jgi:CRISPR-associated protein Csb2